jgi:pilus assembly protein CpaC
MHAARKRLHSVATRWIGFGVAAMAVAFLALSAPGPVLVSEAEAASRVINISGGQRVGKLTVTLGQSETIRVSEAFENVVVGDPETADVAPLTDQTLYVLGRRLGSTNISLYNADKQLIAVIDIEVSNNLGGLEFALRRAIPSGNIKVTNVNGRVLLEGTVMNAVDLDKALQIAEDFAPKQVTNSLSIGTNQQVMLEVRFLEAQRTNNRALGLKWNAIANNFSFSTLTSGGLAAAGTPTGQIVANLLGGGQNRIDAFIDALETNGLIRTLAEPNLVALSGEKAEFLAGGEFPIPTARDVDAEGGLAVATITVSYKKFGVSLAFAPTVLANGLINLQIEPEVSEPGPTGFTANGINLPIFITRRANTTLELRDGQSFALAGMFQSKNDRNLDKVPWVGDVPILGTLFRSQGFKKNETDLVIIVTPRLVRPTAPNRPLATPLDNTMSSNDKELFLYGKLEVTKEMAEFIETGGHLKGPFGHIIDLKGGSNRAVYK